MDGLIFGDPSLPEVVELHTEEEIISALLQGHSVSAWDKNSNLRIPLLKKVGGQFRNSWGYPNES